MDKLDKIIETKLQEFLFSKKKSGKELATSIEREVEHDLMSKVVGHSDYYEIFASALKDKIYKCGNDKECKQILKDKIDKHLKHKEKYHGETR